MVIKYGNDHILCRLCELGREKSGTKGMEYARLVGGGGGEIVQKCPKNEPFMIDVTNFYLFTH